MTEPKHIHKLKRKNYKNGTPVFFCTGDECTFKIGVEFALGKTTECWRCGQPFKLTGYSLRLAKPHCENCHKFKNADSIQDIRLEPLRNETNPTDELREQLDSLIQTDVEL